MAAAWNSFSLTVPGEDLLAPASGIIETLVLFLDVLSAILDTVKIFLQDIGNPIKALVTALLAEITQLIETLRKSGIYFYADLPNPLVDPSFKGNAGGFKAFGKRFKASLLDSRDQSRPQPVGGFTTGGYLILCVDADGPAQLMGFLRVLLTLLGKETTQSRYPAPANVKLLPVGSKQDPILSLTGLFSDPPKALSLSWTLPSSEGLFDGSFSGLASSVVSEFTPPKWLIERSSKNPATSEVTENQLGDPSATGVVVALVDTTYQNPRSGNQPIKRKVRVKDEYGDDHIQWQDYFVVDQSSPTFFLGQLGRYRWIDTSVVPDKTYYYRVRALIGDLKVQGTGVSMQLRKDVSDSGRPLLVWPSQKLTEPVVVGKSSGTVSGKLVKLPENFNVNSTLESLFLSALSLDFHVPADPEDQFDSNGLPADEFTLNSHVGRGILVDQAGALSNTAAAVVSELSKTYSGSSTSTGRPVEMPWERAEFKHQAKKLAVSTSSSLLTGGSQLLEGFRSLCQGPLPKGPFQTSWTVPTNSIEKLVAAMTAPPTDDSVKSYLSAYSDPTVRVNIAAVLEYTRMFSLGGDSPDWQSAALLRDIVPWSGETLYSLLGQMAALADAFKGTSEEAIVFIDLIQRKIDVLERFLEYILQVLNFVQSLELSVSVLSVPVIPGGTQEWIAAFDSALNPPTSGPQGYTGGIAFAYLGPDAASIAGALSQIF